MSKAFEYLQRIEARSQENSAGLPLKEKIVNDWVGIGFSANSVRCIARMSEVNEILPLPETIRVPGVKSWVRGLANIRGALIPILDLRGYLVGEDTVVTKKCRVLVVNISGVVAGLLVEEVFGLRRFKEGAQERNVPDEIKNTNLGAYVSSFFSAKNEQWNIFSLKTLLLTDKFLRVV